jgi:hypothetical protein
MHGKNGRLAIALNGFVIAYAERFKADLTTETVPYNDHGNMLQVPTGYRLDLCLKDVSTPDPGAVNDAMAACGKGVMLNFEFRGYYKTAGGALEQVTFSHCVPKCEDLADYLDGLVVEWEFTATPPYDGFDEIARKFGNAANR